MEVAPSSSNAEPVLISPVADSGKRFGRPIMEWRLLHGKIHKEFHAYSLAERQIHTKWNAQRAGSPASRYGRVPPQVPPPNTQNVAQFR